MSMINRSSIYPSRKAALVIAHPGHELRVYHWLEKAHPVVFILTDGSVRSEKSRLESTTRLLEQAGARACGIYGRFTDLKLYHSILMQDLDCFTRLVEELADALAGEEVEYTVGDAIEGYNPAHDICRLIINAAAGIVRRRYNRSLAKFDFLLAGAPDTCPPQLQDQAIRLCLSDGDFKRKLNAALSYPALLDEIQSAFSAHRPDAFRVECLRPVSDSGCAYLLDKQPFYEGYGEKQVATGRYTQVLRYREHMLPLADGLRRYVERDSS
jgi:hypothetical protein